MTRKAGNQLSAAVLPTCSALGVAPTWPDAFWMQRCGSIRVPPASRAGFRQRYCQHRLAQAECLEVAFPFFQSSAAVSLLSWFS